MPAVRLKKFEVQDRRRKVAGLLLRRVAQWKIAELLDVKRYTVSRDAAALLQQWRIEAGAATVEVVARELAELDDMERQVCERFEETHAVEWANARLRIMQRRAKMLGLDEPKVWKLVGPDGGPIQVEQSGAALARQVLEDPELRSLSRQMQHRTDELNECRERQQIVGLNGHRRLPDNPRLN